MTAHLPSRCLGKPLYPTFCPSMELVESWGLRRTTKKPDCTCTTLLDYLKLRNIPTSSSPDYLKLSHHHDNNDNTIQFAQQFQLFSHPRLLSNH